MINKATLLGRVGKEPEIANMNNGNKVAKLTIATSETWKDKATGEKKESTQWHNVVIFSQGLVGVVERFVKKGSKVYLEGQIQTREWEKDGSKRYITEIVLQNFNSNLILLDDKKTGDSQPVDNSIDDSIPFEF